MIIHNKVRKGDIVGIRVRHTSTDIKVAPTEYFTLAQVRSASRKGLATRVILAGTSYTIDIQNDPGEVMAIMNPQRQAQAKVLFATTSANNREFKDMDALRSAIIAVETNVVPDHEAAP